MNKEPRHPKFYKKIKFINDKTNEELEHSLKNCIFNQFKKPEYAFNIFDKMGILKDSIDPNLNGNNSITNKIYGYDYSKAQYKNLKLNDINYNDEKIDKKINQWVQYIISKVVPELKKMVDVSLKFMIINHRHILNKLIIYRSKNLYSFVTFRNDIFKLLKIAKLILGDDNEINKKLSIIATDLNKGIVQKQENLNKLNRFEERGFIEYKELLNLTEMMDKEFQRSLEVKGVKDDITYKLHLFSLILKCYIWTPPVRSEIKNIYYTDTLKDLNDSFNYIYVPKNNDIVQFIFNDKIKGHQPIRYNVGYINDSLKDFAIRLNEDIKKSFDLYPRPYLITTLNSKMKPALNNLSNYLKIMFDNRPLNINNLRSASLSYIQSLNLPYNILEDISLKMRSSVLMQRSNYNKILDLSDPPKEPPILNLPKAQEKPYKSCRDQEKARSAKYYNKHRVKIIKQKQTYYKNYKNLINAKNCINRINKIIQNEDKNAKPIQTSIDKYELYKLNGLWQSKLLDDQEKL